MTRNVSTCKDESLVAELGKLYDQTVDCLYARQLSGAIEHRREEIRLIRRLHKLAQGQDAASADFILGQYGPADLRDRLYLLAKLYREADNLTKAIAALEESRTLCQASGIKFEQKDLLRKYLREASAAPA
jgi:hypothetical protein